jgi:hypothetical protein
MYTTLYIEPLSMCKLRGDKLCCWGQCALGVGGGGGMRHRLVSKHGGQGTILGGGGGSNTHYRGGICKDVVI